jgi:hypothetical protein
VGLTLAGLLWDAVLEHCVSRTALPHSHCTGLQGCLRLQERQLAVACCPFYEVALASLLFRMCQLSVCVPAVVVCARTCSNSRSVCCMCSHSHSRPHRDLLMAWGCCMSWRGDKYILRSCRVLTCIACYVLCAAWLACSVCSTCRGVVPMKQLLLRPSYLHTVVCGLHAHGIRVTFVITGASDSCLANCHHLLLQSYVSTSWPKAFAVALLRFVCHVQVLGFHLSLAVCKLPLVRLSCICTAKVWRLNGEGLWPLS